MKIICPNCEQRFMDDNPPCPRCGWDPYATIEQVELPADPEVDDGTEEAEADEELEETIEETAQELEPGPGFTSLEELNVGQLQPMARDLKVKKWYDLNKEDLIKAIKKKQKKLATTAT